MCIYLLRQAPPTVLDRPVYLGNDLYVCGDHRDTATFDGKDTMFFGSYF